MARISRITRKRLGELLRDEELVSEEQLQAALALQEKERRPLGEVLVDQGTVTEESIARLVAHQYGLPFLDPSRYSIAEEVKDIFPEAALLKYHFVPLDDFGTALLICISGAVDMEVVEEIEGLASKRIHVMVGTNSAVRRVQVEQFHTAGEQLTGLGNLLLGDGEVEES
jgi:hypothetical protein